MGGLKKVPKEYVDLDLEATSSSDQHDNGVLTYVLMGQGTNGISITPGS